jgi:hypothetical protein
MTRVLLAWEAGAGRGHVVTLTRVARALEGIAECDAALGWMDHTAEIAPWCARVFPSVCLPYRRAERRARLAPPNATWADYLNDIGFADEEQLRVNVAWWLDTFERRDIGLLIADYAPCALMAARIAGIPSLAVGTGYGIPPPGLSGFPVFLPEYAAREADEARLAEGINRALGPLGLPRLSSLPEVYARSGEMVRTLPLLDPYAAWRDADAYLPPVADFAGQSDGGGTDVFCYFSTTELASEALVEALCACPFPLRAFLPGAPDAVRACLSSAGVRIENAAVPVEEIARTSRLVLNSGQHGILCLALAAGIPQLCFPQHLEQLYHARRVEAAGAARVVWPRNAPCERIVETIGSTWQDERMSERARSLAREQATRFVADDLEMMRAGLLPWLGTPEPAEKIAQRRADDLSGPGDRAYPCARLRSSSTRAQIALTTTDPSPTAEATLLTDPERTSPTANTPGSEVS